MTRWGWKRFWGVAATAGLVACLLAAPAAAERGALDRSFGERGSVTTPAPLGGHWSQAKVQVAATADGGSVVASGAKLYRYTATGQLDSAFGSGGTLEVKISDSLEFKATDLAVDPEGRIVAIGTATRWGSSRQPQPSFAAVVRYLPDGSPDPSFGDDGHVTSDFGLHSRAGAPPVVASFGAVGKTGEVTLVVGKVERRASCGGPPRLGEHDLLVARLGAEGHPDRSFGERGTRRIGALEEVAAMAFSQDGEIMLAGPLPRRCGNGPESAVISLAPDGSPRRSFGTRRFTGRAAAIAVDHRGRTVVLFHERQTAQRNEHDYKVLRLLPDGGLDPDFSGGWVVFEAEGPSYQWSSLAIDSHNRPLLIGTLVRELPPQRRGPRFHRWMMVVPLRESGLNRGGFGFRGWIAITRLDSSSDATASEGLLEGEHRLLLAGTVQRPSLAPRGGIGLVRLEI